MMHFCGRWGCLLQERKEHSSYVTLCLYKKEELKAHTGQLTALMKVKAHILVFLCQDALQPQNFFFSDD